MQQQSLDNKQRDISVTNMSSQISRNSHVESGTVWCGDSSKYNDGMVMVNTEDGSTFESKTKQVPVRFSRSYGTTPLVFLVMQDAWWEKEKNAGITVEAVHITKQGFTARCAIYKNINHSIWDLRVRWLSLPH